EEQALGRGIVHSQTLVRHRPNCKPFEPGRSIMAGSALRCRFGLVGCGAPAVLNMILDAAAEWKGPIPGAGRVRIVVAGAPPPTRTIERCETELGWEFVQIYGLTETAPVLTMNRGRAEWDDLTAGERATLLNRAGAPVIGCTMDADAEGEVLARGNMIMEGYWEQPEATAEAIRDGFFHTGDGGSIEATNYVTINDRKKDVIISGGENVSSIE
ncbi:MAG: AMP-binding protein, partial [Ilumatobacter sp.]